MSTPSTWWTIPVLLAFLIASCSGSVPSETTARDVFASKYQDKIDKGLVVIESFSKVNAKQGEVFGVKVYEVEYRATIKWPKGSNTQCLLNPCLGFGEIRNIGQVEDLHGTLGFEMTEQGWKGENGKVY
jgi:hypothetical protein